MCWLNENYNTCMYPHLNCNVYVYVNENCNIYVCMYVDDKISSDFSIIYIELNNYGHKCECVL